MDANEIAARLKNLKGAKTECPQCGSAKWANPPRNGRFFLLVTYAEEREAEQIPLIPLICGNCGFVRFHDEEKLHD